MGHYYPAIKELEDVSDEELREFFKPLSKSECWLYKHLCLLWRLVHWNWFNIFTGEEGFWLFFRHGFREWKEEHNG